MTDPLSEAAVTLQAAVSLHQAGNLQEAEATYRRVLVLDPANPDALGLLGLIHHVHGERDAAIRLLRAAIAIQPASRFYYNLGLALEGAGDIPGCVAAFRQAAQLDPSDIDGWTASIFNVDLHSYTHPAIRLADRRAFNAQHCATLTAQAPPHENDPDPDRRLRIGYISADFADHSAAMVFGPVLAGHDHAVVEVFCYWQQRGPADAFTEQFKAQADHWREIAPLSDADLAALIRQDRIDILVDLSGYSNGHRLLALARKPAPIIMTGWGHVTGLGLDAIDYILADAISAPPDRARYYHEHAIHLPCILAYDPRPPYPDVTPPPVAANGYVTFGYMGRAIKANEAVWAAWATILHRVPRSRLVFKGHEYTNQTWRTRITEFFASLRISSHRLDFLGSTHREQHLAAYGGIDIALDPFPHGGGVTLLEACLMGVPTVALLGDHLNGRIAASVLATIGRGQFIGADVERYVEIAVQLGHTAMSLATRESIRDALLGSIICDPHPYAGAVEAAYRNAWRAWVAEHAPVERTLTPVGA